VDLPNAAGPRAPADASVVATVEPNPLSIWKTVNAYQQTAALRAAVELDLFTAVGEGATTVGAIAARAGASERGIRILSDYLVTTGLLGKNDGRFHLTPDSAAFLDRRSPAYMGGILQFINSRELMRGYDDLTETVRRGRTLLEGAGVVDPEDEVWIDFARSMVPIIMPAAEHIAGMVTSDARARLRVLDIAAGHGMFGIAIARRHPNATIVALDWPQVLEVARENAVAAGVAERFEPLAGDAFKVDFGSGYDVVLVTNLYHHFDVAQYEALARKVHACLAPGGRTFTLEFVPNEDRVTPLIPASFALMMLGATVAGDAYPFSVYEEIFRKAGFSRTELHPMVPQSPQQLMVSVRD
jgi:2-polyprenyl-3-methyl-5-hydroxy-6-metoxy-1,4-benzoquinol methylase